MKYYVLFLTLVSVAGCGVGSSPQAMTTGEPSETALSETNPGDTAPSPPAMQATPPFVFVTPEVPTFTFVDPVLSPGGVDNVLGALLDALLVGLLDPVGVGSQPVPSLTFLERLCFEGDDPDFVCSQRFGR